MKARIVKNLLQRQRAFLKPHGLERRPDCSPFTRSKVRARERGPFKEPRFAEKELSTSLGSPENCRRFPLSPSEGERAGVRDQPWDSGAQSALICWRGPSPGERIPRSDLTRYEPLNSFTRREVTLSCSEGERAR